MPVVEAMACGTRVAHSSNTAMDEISGELALRAPAMDVDAWTQILKIMIDENDDPDARMKRIAQSATFNWDKTADIVSEAYDRVANQL